MKKLRNHFVGIAQGDVVLFSDYLDGGEMWTGTGQRIVRRRVQFDTGFVSAPAVTLQLSMWDTDNATNMRADMSSEDVTSDGFDLVFGTWGDSRWARVRIAWTAIGELPHEDDWSLY